MRRALDDLAPLGLAVMRRVSSCWRTTWPATVPDDPALVLAIDHVLDERSTITTNAAAPQLRIELFEHLRGDLAN